jgi:hypothetical protein
MVPQDPKATQKAKRKNKNDKRKNVSLTEDARVNSGVSA